MILLYQFGLLWSIIQFININHVKEIEAIDVELNRTVVIVGMW